MDAEIDVLKYVPEHYRSVVERFIIDHWEQLASDCYRHYRKQGRGMMTVFLGDNSIDVMYISWMWLQLHWDDAFINADCSIQATIKRLVPAYNPDDECVFLFEFDDDEPSAVIQITQAIFSRLIEQPGTVVPRICRREGLTPKEAYEKLAK